MGGVQVEQYFGNRLSRSQIKYKNTHDNSMYMGIKIIFYGSLSIMFDYWQLINSIIFKVTYFLTLIAVKRGIRLYK